MRNYNLMYLAVLAPCTALASPSNDSLNTDVGSAADGVTDTVIVTASQQSWFEQSSATALKMDAEQLDTPFSQNTINAAMLEDLKASTLEAAYGYMAGMSRSGESANAFTIRGMSADLQNVQVDGLPGLVSRFGAPVTANIERVDVLKGPASVLYGLMEPGGLVNIVTKKPQAEQHGQVDLAYQNYVNQSKGGYNGSFDVTGALDDDGEYLYRLIGGAEHSNSFRNYVDTNTRYLYPSFSRVWAYSRLDVQLEYTYEKRGADQGLALADGTNLDSVESIETYYQEPGDFERDEGYALGVSYVQQLNNDTTLNVKWRSVLHEDENQRYENNRVNTDGTLRRRDRHQLNRRGYHFLDTSLNWSFDGIVRHDLMVGINGGYEYRQYDRLDWRTSASPIAISDPVYYQEDDSIADDPHSMRRWKLYNAGVYAFDRLYLSDQWTLVGGARYDQQQGDYRLFYLDNDTTDRQATRTSSTNFNAGVVYQPLLTTSLYASYAESFDPQTVGTLDADGNQLDPEQAEQYEVGSKYASEDQRLNLQLALFDITKHNIVEENEAGDNELLGTVHSRGAEFNGQYQLSAEWQLQANYAWVNARITDTTEAETRYNAPAFAPVHSGSVWTRYNYPQMIAGGFVGGSFGAKYQSERYTGTATSSRVRLPGYTVMDMALYYERMNSKYSLTVANLTNEVYYSGGRNALKLWPGEPTKVTLAAQFNF